MNGIDRIVLTALNRAEALRYMGYDGVSPDEKISALIDRCESELLRVIKPCYVYKVFDTEHKENAVELKGATLRLTGNSICEHLRGCTKCVLMAATVSAGADKVIRRLEAEDMTSAVITDFLASTAIEQVCDEAQAIITQELSGYNSTWRFSPGYGDLPLDIQGGFLDILDAPRRIGLNVTDTNILTPRKSVTAVIGLSTEEISKGRLSCEICNMRDKCQFRKRGIHCER